MLLKRPMQFVKKESWLMSDIGVLMTSVGAYLPKKILTNEDLSAFVDTDDEWIRQRTGITQRHIVADGELTSDMAREAALQAMQGRWPWWR